MKKYRVWGYEKQGYYTEVEANNKQDAHDKAMDVERLDWEMGEDRLALFDIELKDIERIDNE